MPIDAKRAVGLTVALFVGLLLAAYLMPTVIAGISDDQKLVENQTVSETVDLKPNMTATLDSVTSGTSATYTVTYNGDSASATVNVGANGNVTVDGTTVEITPQEVTSTYAVTEYRVPATTGWGAAGALWLVIPIFLILPIFMWVVRGALQQR